MLQPKYNKQERLVLLGQIVDIFEDFLEEKGITIPNDEKEKAIKDGEDPDSICNIYGTDYGVLSDSIEQTLIKWDIL